MGKIKDLTGQKFNRLTVIKDTGKRNSHGNVIWECKCDCGNIVEVAGTNLRGNTKSCGCLHRETAKARFEDLTGMKFHKLTVISLNEERSTSKGRYYNCLCDCGNMVVVRSGSLTQKTRPVKSCGCLHKESMRKTAIDLTGKRFDRLVVIGIDEQKTNKKRGIYWICQCDCGNIKSIRSENLRKGQTKSCGCLNVETATKKGKNNAKDLTGQRFGKLVVKRKTDERKGSFCVWECECDCGNTYKVASGLLRNGTVKSCGCLHKETCSGSGSYMWKGGITAIKEHLRHFTKQWDKEIRQKYNGYCCITGEKVNSRTGTVHHLFGFNMIIDQAHLENNIDFKSQVQDYSKEELEILENYVLEKHKNLENGVLLSKKIHKLFHRKYKYGNNTPEQFEEFKERYMAGEFDNELI